MATGYGRRSLIETAMGRYNHLIGPRLRARSLPGQQGEAAIAVAVLNRMIRTAKPSLSPSAGYEPVLSNRGISGSIPDPCTSALWRLKAEMLVAKPTFV